ncbi:MAG: anti-sigma factor family protein [Planctomycetota bacterium]|jgi:hypothetical protein
MNCAECKGLLVGYIEKLLEDSQKQAVESHLETRPPCRAELAQITSLRERLTANGKALAHSNLEDAVFDRIVREQSVKLRKAAKIDRQIWLWRIIMNSKITKLAAAAIIVIAAISITFLDKLTSPVYAIEETFEAMRQVRTVHAFCTDWDGGKVECWATLDPETGWEDGIYAHTEATDDVLVSTPEITYFYYAESNVVRVDKGLAPASEVRVGRFMEDLVDYVTRQKDGRIDIRREHSQETAREVIVVHGVSSLEEFVAVIDPESKLPISMNMIKARGGMKSIDEIYYDQPLPIGVFEFQAPEGAEVVIHRAQPEEVLDDPDAGMKVEGLGEEEACAEIIKEYWQAVIDQDWRKARQLRPLPEDTWQKLIDKHYADYRPVELLEVEPPYRHEACWIGPITPYLLKMASGQHQTGEMIVKFRQIAEQESCVIAGPWGRELDVIR